MIDGWHSSIWWALRFTFSATLTTWRGHWDTTDSLFCFRVSDGYKLFVVLFHDVIQKMVCSICLGFSRVLLLRASLGNYETTFDMYYSAST